MEKTHPKPKENLFLIKAEETYIAFDPEEGDKWELNETGAFIVKKLIEGTSLEEIKDKIMDEYSIDSEKAEESLQKYMEQLTQEGILV